MEIPGRRIESSSGSQFDTRYKGSRRIKLWPLQASTRAANLTKEKENREGKLRGKDEKGLGGKRGKQVVVQARPNKDSGWEIIRSDLYKI